MALPPSATSAYTSSNFFPKFDNEDTAQDARLTSRASTSEPKCLAITKKHSGHLVMAPPFYSKNGVGNSFSRMGALLLLTRFHAVFPDSPSSFADWYLHAEKSRLCYSFECVVPSLLGDHGATPGAAYMVLTCVSTAAGTFLSPAQVLALATRWRLPLNEAWYVPWSAAASVEASLHEHRWTMTDADAAVVLKDTGPHQYFLTHGEVRTK